MPALTDAPKTTAFNHLHHVENVLATLSRRGFPFNIQQYGEVAYPSRTYPLTRIVLGAENSPRVAIVAGVHGHEPAGVHAALEFLTRNAVVFSDKFRLEVYPCANPSGLDRGTRETAGLIDLNRSFGCGCQVPEIKALLSSMRASPQKYELLLDLHEDMPETVSDCQGPTPNGTYFYSSCPKGDQFACRLAGSFAPALLYGGDDVYGDQCHNAIVDSTAITATSPYAKRLDLEQFAFHSQMVKRALTVDTPGHEWDLKTRIELHNHAICCALTILDDQQ